MVKTTVLLEDEIITQSSLSVNFTSDYITEFDVIEDNEPFAYIICNNKNQEFGVRYTGGHYKLLKIELCKRVNFI